MVRHVLVAVAWPYANGPLHLGHVAGSLLPPDIFARYHRMAGNHVLMVSGSDMHGTPITVKAEQEGVAPEALAQRYHEQHKKDLAALAIEFGGAGSGDLGPGGIFTSTATDNHRRVVHDIFRTLLARGDIARRTMRAPYDPKAKRFLPDRYVEGTCPHCQFPEARGDQCDQCGRTLDPQELRDPRSKISGATPEYRDTEHFFLLLGRFEAPLKKWVEQQAKDARWRANTINFTRNWLQEGLKERAITRDLAYGVPLPPEVEAQDPSFKGKRIYVWFEAVIGYLSAAQGWAQRQGKPDAWRDWWLVPSRTVRTEASATWEGARHYYFLGKDNVPFHTIIWPAIILGYANGKGEPYQLPWDVPANEFLNFGGTKFSKSRGNIIMVQDVASRFHPDSVRYYLTAIMPENGDTEWNWTDFVAKVNDELVAKLGNYAYRVLTMCSNSFGGTVPSQLPSTMDEDWKNRESSIRKHLKNITVNLEGPSFSRAMYHLMRIAELGNRQFHEHAPWKFKDATSVLTGIATQADLADYERIKAQKAEILAWHLSILKTLSLVMAPFLPRAAQELWGQLGEEGSVHAQPWPRDIATLQAGQPLREPRVLFPKIDPDTVKDLLGEPMPEPAPQAEPAPLQGERVSLAEFQRLDLRVGVVRSVDPHPKADKLYVLKVDIGGEERQLVAGLRPYVKPEELLGKRVIVVANLEPATLRGVASQGMLLAAELDDKVVPLTTAGDIGPGARVR